MTINFLVKKILVACGEDNFFCDNVTASNYALRIINYALEKAPAINGGFGDFVIGRNDET